MRPLEFNIRVLRFLTLWPDESSNVVTNKFLAQHILVVCTLLPSASTLFTGLIRQLASLEDINTLLDHVIGLGTLVAMVYMSECFLRNAGRVRQLVTELAGFAEQFGAGDVIQATELRVLTYTKAILLYGIVGNLCYALFPLLTIAGCERDRQAPELAQKRDPCGLIVRVWYPFDVHQRPRFHAAYVLQLYTCLVISTVVLALTMSLVGLLMYTVAFLGDLRRRVVSCCRAEKTDGEQTADVLFCLRYHTAIILSMMVVHLTLTSFEISVLGFEVLMLTSRTDSLRFGLHLFGWLVLLFLICFYGQKLIDESTGLAMDAYSTAWYQSPVSVQKNLLLMILRSQKPLTLSAASLGVMSLETYLGVLSTAYSYFTLLLKVKNN